MPPIDFERFDEPGYVKIVWMLEADELPPGQESILRTRIRVKTTDPSARRRFRRYWAILSPGIIIVHHEIVRLARREIDRRDLPSNDSDSTSTARVVSRGDDSAAGLENRPA